MVFCLLKNEIQWVILEDSDIWAVEWFEQSGFQEYLFELWDCFLESRILIHKVVWDVKVRLLQGVNLLNFEIAFLTPWSSEFSNLEERSESVKGDVKKRGRVDKGRLSSAGRLLLARSHVLGLFFGYRLNAELPQPHLRFFSHLHILFFLDPFLLQFKSLFLVVLHYFGTFFYLFSENKASSASTNYSATYSNSKLSLFCFAHSRVTSWAFLSLFENWPITFLYTFNCAIAQSKSSSSCDSTS